MATNKHDLTPFGYDGTQDVEDFLVQFGYNKETDSIDGFCLATFNVDLNATEEIEADQNSDPNKVAIDPNQHEQTH